MITIFHAVLPRWDSLNSLEHVVAVDITIIIIIIVDSTTISICTFSSAFKSQFMSSNSALCVRQSVSRQYTFLFPSTRNMRQFSFFMYVYIHFSEQI